MPLNRQMVLFACVLYFLSLMLPAVSDYGGKGALQGYVLLLTGPLGMLEGELRWVANVFFFVAAIMVAQQERRIVLNILFAVFGAGLAVSCLWIPVHMYDPRHSYLAQPFAGMYFWIAAFIVLLLASFVAPKGVQNPGNDKDSGERHA